MKQPPTLSVVVIGRNEGSRLVRCIESIRQMDFDLDKVEIIYVDSNSTDNSPSTARRLGARVITLDTVSPTAAAGRNAGWRDARAPNILFLDGDTILEPGFLKQALTHLEDPEVAVVWGHRRELYPERSIYNAVLDLDWIYAPGDTEFCGGDALFRVSALEAVDGFDASLIAGEEPDLCRRLRAIGYRIHHADIPMTRHDLAIVSLRQYWRRCYRAGHAYAEIAHRSRNTGTPLWHNECRRNINHGLCILALPIAGAALTLVSASLLPIAVLAAGAGAVITRSVRKCRWKEPRLWNRLPYALHAHLQQLPILAGQVAYWRNRSARQKVALIEYKEAS